MRMNSDQRLLRKSLWLTAIALLSSGMAHADVVLDDFSGGVSAVNHPEGSGQFGVWYDATNNTFGTPSASTLNGNPAMSIADGGFTNGVYVIYQAVVPADGEYSISADIKVNEPGSATGFSSYQMGVAVGADAQHRGPNPSALAGLPIVASYTGLTSGDDSANPIETVQTATFTASAGDNILIAFATDVASGAWNGGSSLWSGNTVQVDNIILVDENDDNGGGEPVDVLVVNDFENGVIGVNSPNGAGVSGVWYDTTESTFGTPSASVLEDSSAMRIDDGGFANGVYAIYDGLIPADGTYTIEAKIDVVEAGAVNGIISYQIGASVGSAAQHRDSILPATQVSGTYVGLTPADDTDLPPQVVVSQEFTAQAGDDLLVALSTDVQSGEWGPKSPFWSGSFVLVDDIILRRVEDEDVFELIVDDDDGAPGFTATGFSQSGGIGFNGGNYKFAGVGSAGAKATWTADIPTDGHYRVSTYFLAGANRATNALYEVTLPNGTSIEVPVDQQANNLVEVILGEFEITAGQLTVDLNAEASSGGSVVIADTVTVTELEGPPGIDEPEMRIANMLVFDNLDNTDRIQSLIDDIADKRYNAVAVHTRYRGDALYFPNKTDDTFTNNEPRNPLVGDIDVLEETIARGKAAGLKVFAYVNTMLVTEGQDTDPRPNHVINQHPEWITWEYNNGNPEPHTTETEVDGIWLDPALPEVQEYNANIVADIVLNYDVDGIMIDRQRYPDTRFDRLEADYGYHPDAVAEFNRLTGSTGLPDPFDQTWWQFRKDANTKSIQKIYDAINTIDPDVLLLSYPIGRLEDATNFNYQDWSQWLDNGVIDAVLPQIYTDNNGEFTARAAEHRFDYTGDRLLGPVIDVFRPGVDLVFQVEASRAYGFDGQALFYHSIAGSLGYFSQFPEAWPGFAEFPATPWKDEPLVCDGFDIIGTENDDVLIGTVCDELIIGGIGNDELRGGAGTDYLVPDASQEEEAEFPSLASNRNDIVDGGDGIDTVDYSNVRAPILVDLRQGIAKKAVGNDGIGEDTLIGIENIIGREGGDEVYIGDDNDNMIWTNGLEPSNPSLAGEFVDAGAGDDYINTGGPGVGSNATEVYAGPGDDEVIGNDGRANTVWAGEGDDTVYAYGGQDTVYGEAGDDYLDGGDGTDFLYGGEGNDVLEGGAGKDKVLMGGPGDDIINGGPTTEDDRAYFSGTTADYIVKEEPNGDLTVIDLRGIDGTDTITNVNRLGFSDRLVSRRDYASKIPNYTGGDGDDTYNGGAGNDTLVGGLGDDTLNGFEGNDKLIGGEGNDILDGGAGKDKELIGGPGNDTIIGGPTNEDDRARLSGAMADYEVFQALDGTLTVTDLRGIDGVDTMIRINRIWFADGLIHRKDFDSKLPNFTRETE